MAAEATPETLAGAGDALFLALEAFWLCLVALEASLAAFIASFEMSAWEGFVTRWMAVTIVSFSQRHLQGVVLERAEPRLYRVSSKGQGSSRFRHGVGDSCFLLFGEVVVGYCIGSCRELRVEIFFCPRDDQRILSLHSWGS